MGQGIGRRSLSEDESEAGMMIDRIISYLKTSGVTAWEITDELTYGWEFYFIRHELDQNRVKNVETIILKVYQAIENGEYLGSAEAQIDPTASGSAYGAQMLDRMEKEVPQLWDKVGKGDLSPVTAWLHEKIHRFSALFTPQEILDQVCGGFDPSYYIRYLTEKYSELYNLN